eukprot:TRINITY_DN1538_c0_g1_i2.p2 TRINITY_DN1538_c0_g1~~TRINITY_DN1538_c0_g1_i2.p2  ORF type:complete len:122 (-),score=27.14 TRINITY_DN1538_c0_g1_i2:54-419(-)
MRNKAIPSLSGQPPEAKWKGLFSMFKEWRSQTNIAEGQYAASQSAETHSNKELEDSIRKIRGAIYELRQKSSITPKDEALLSVLQRKLKAKNEELFRRHRARKPLRSAHNIAEEYSSTDES